jgi:hypothetical protein
MTVLALKLLLTPAVITGATLAGRRFGQAASGWLIGLPLTSGPIVLVFSAEHGRRFAARAAVGSLGGAIAEVAFCVAYVVPARRWGTAVVTGSLGFAATAAILEALPLDLTVPVILTLAACAVAALSIGLQIVRASGAAPLTDVLTSRWDLPARAVVATAFLLTLTAIATTLGARLSGLLAVYPLYSAVLAVFAHRSDGREGSQRVLRGLLVGLFSFVAFFTVLAVALPRLATGTAFAAALVAALVVQAASLPLLFNASARSSVDRATAF